MSDLTVAGTAAMDPHAQRALRRRAADRLAAPSGTAAASPAAGMADALSVLHALASSPQSAADALALLHELQVHQVEIELQAQELRESRAELETALRSQVARHDALPVGCVVVDAAGTVIELNQTAAGLLGLPRGRAPGQHIGTFLAADDRQRFDAALAGLHADRPAHSFVLGLAAAGQQPRQVLARLGRDAASGEALLCLAAMDALP